MAITAYPDRTSPVLRGKWLLDNILGANPPPPPANVDTSLDQSPEAEVLGIRERLERHRLDPLCASCHTLMDPLGFALEEFDAVERGGTPTRRVVRSTTSGLGPAG